METETLNEQLFKLLIEEGFSRGDVTVFDKYTSQDFVEHQYGFSPPNIEGVKKAINSLHQAFTDFSMVIEDVAANDNIVWGRMTARGTQVGQFGPMPLLVRKSRLQS
jgi:hypothetical protein